MGFNYWDIVYGVDTRARPRNSEKGRNSFERPLIHQQITGNKVYVPLDTKRLWGN